MAEKIQLEVVTPERRVLAEPVDMVTVPGLGGELGILPGHTPLISQLQTGVLDVRAGGEELSVARFGWLCRSAGRSRFGARRHCGTTGRDRRRPREALTRQARKTTQRLDRIGRGTRNGEN